MKSLLLSLAALFALIVSAAAAPAWRVVGSDQASHMLTVGSRTVGVGIHDPSTFGGTIAAELDLTAPLMSSTWHSGSFTMKVDTIRHKGESAGNQAYRHKQAVTALAQVYPPNTTGALLAAPCVGYSASWTSHAQPFAVHGSAQQVCTPDKSDGLVKQATVHSEAAHALFAIFPAG